MTASSLQMRGWRRGDTKELGIPPDMTDPLTRVAPSWLPPTLRSRVNLNELSGASAAVLRTQRELERDLHCHVAVYRRGAKGQAHGLCSLYRAAQLPVDQLRRLHAAQSCFRGVVFVAYARPLEYQRRVSLGGRLMPRIGLGTMRLIGPAAWGPPLDPAQSSRVLQSAVEHGVRLLDTADAYGLAHCEALIAKALYPYPDDLVLSTKGGIDRRSRDQWIPDGSPAHLATACEGSLRRLRIESIPLYLLHTVDPKIPIEDSVGAMRQLQTQGKIKDIGLCNVSVKQIERAATVASITCVENRYNYTDRTHQDVLTFCEQQQIPFIAWAPLDGGRLAARSSAVEPADENSAAEALRWILGQSPVTVAIPGAATVDELLDDIVSLSF